MSWFFASDGLRDGTRNGPIAWRLGVRQWMGSFAFLLTMITQTAQTRAADAPRSPADPVSIVGAGDGDKAEVEPVSSTVRAVAEQAVQHYHESDYLAALELFQRAYQLDPHPLYLYNQAQCQRQLKQLTAACDNYQAYLQASVTPKPEAAIWANRLAAFCTVRLAAPTYIEESISNRDTSALRPGPPSSAAPSEPRPEPERVNTPFWRRSRLAWTALAAGTGAALAASLFVVQQRVYRNDLRDLQQARRSSQGDEYAAQVSKLQRAQTLTWAFAGIAAALGATGTLLLVLPQGSDSPSSVAVDVGTGIAASYRHHF